MLLLAGVFLFQNECAVAFRPLPSALPTGALCQRCAPICLQRKHRHQVYAGGNHLTQTRIMPLITEPEAIEDLSTVVFGFASFPVMFAIVAKMMPQPIKANIANAVSSAAVICRAASGAPSSLQKEELRKKQRKELKKTAKHSSSIACKMYFKNIIDNNQLQASTAFLRRHLGSTSSCSASGGGLDLAADVFASTTLCSLDVFSGEDMLTPRSTTTSMHGTSISSTGTLSQSGTSTLAR